MYLLDVRCLAQIECYVYTGNFVTLYESMDKRIVVRYHTVLPL